ncbi:MAG TPA: extracellular solute-binding protein [Alphaproteobacteria bacterium]|jgi:iron(III) transport system substrate-binding protein
MKYFYPAITGVFFGCMAWSSAFAADAIDISDWSAVVAKAKQEGIVVVHGAPGKSYNEVFVAAFNKAYPDIKVQFSGTSNRTDVPRLLRERKAGMYAWDVWASGPTTALNSLKPEGVFQPFDTVLRPEIKDDSKWFGGFGAGWMDVDKNLFYAFDGTVQNPILVNWDVVKHSDLVTAADLLKPQFAGKIVWDDPRLGGSGNGASQTFVQNYGDDFLLKLFGHNVVFSDNKRQQAEWLVRGRYPIAIGADEAQLDIFQAQGIGKNVETVPDSFFKVQQLSSGFGGVGLVDRAPNPYAAVVYINWLLSQEGQTAWSAVPRTSRRTDVPNHDETLVPRPGITYFNGQEERLSVERRRLLDVARQNIKAEMPKSQESAE